MHLGMKWALPAMAWVMASGAMAQDGAPTTPPATPVAPAAPAAPAAPQYRLQYVTLTTALGNIVLALEVERAPISAANFLRYVDARRFDGLTFYRALDMGRGYGLIQGGPSGNPRLSYPPIAHEPTSRTGLSHTDGAISFARAAPGSAQGDFFIILGGLPSLDAQPAGSGGDSDGFAVFGHVAGGMDVVRAILSQPTDPNAGPGVMRGQMIAAPVRILTARRSAAPPPADPPAAAPPVATPAPATTGG